MRYGKKHVQLAFTPDAHALLTQAANRAGLPVTQLLLRWIRPRLARLPREPARS